MGEFGNVLSVEIDPVKRISNIFIFVQRHPQQILDEIKQRGGIHI